MLYGILLFTIVNALFAYLSKGKKNRLLYTLTTIVLVVYCGLKYPFIYPDIENYFVFFNGYTYHSTENFGVGYLALNQIVRWISSSFYVFLMIVSVIVIISYTNVIKKYSPYIWLSLILYILINYYPSFFLLRQYLAIAVVLFALQYVVKRDFIKFGICSVVAYSFHATALLAVPLYFLYGLKGNIKNMILLTVGSVLVIVMFMSAAQYVSMFSTYYASYFETETEESMWQRTLLKIYIAGIYIYTLRKKVYLAGINRLVFYGMVLNVVICVSAMNIFSAHRLREYFAYADFIGIPLILYEASNFRGFKKIVIYLLVIIYIGALAISFNNFITGPNMNNQYEFFWNRTIR